MKPQWIINLCCSLMVACGWFSLWAISCHFIPDYGLAVLLGPFALRLGVTLHSPMRLWPAIYLTEWGLIILLALLFETPLWILVLSASFVSLPLAWLALGHYSGTQWRRLGVMGALIVATSMTNACIAVTHHESFWMVLLIGVTGGLMVVPACYLIWHYLFSHQWPPLTANMAKRPVSLRWRKLCLYGLLFGGNIIVQMGLPDEMRRFAPFCLAVPIIVLAFKDGWRGAFLGTLLNSVALTSARGGASDLMVTDLLLSLSAQSLTGLLLGAGVEQLRSLNTALRSQLDRNRRLSQHLVTAEESVRRDIARELHDEIGQNITAIRMQAGILKRVNTSPAVVSSANMIESVSLNIYDTTKQLLTRLRPKVLDDMGLKESIEQLVRDLGCLAAGVRVQITWRANEDVDKALSDAMRVTLYRLCQEALNNILKHACASKADIELCFRESVSLSIKDNGIGFDPAKASGGFGLQGMAERIEVLGGTLTFHSTPHQEQSGTHLMITLPRI